MLMRPPPPAPARRLVLGPPLTLSSPWLEKDPAEIVIEPPDPAPNALALAAEPSARTRLPAPKYTLPLALLRMIRPPPRPP